MIQSWRQLVLQHSLLNVLLYWMALTVWWYSVIISIPEVTAGPWSASVGIRNNIHPFAVMLISVHSFSTYQFDKRAKSNVREKSGFIKTSLCISGCLMIAGSHKKKEAARTIFIASVVFELRNFCLCQNVDDILELSLLSCPYSSIKTRVAFDFLRQQLCFPEPPVKLASVLSCKLGSLERSPGFTGSLSAGAWSCFDIIVYATAHSASKGPDGTGQLWKQCVSAAAWSPMWELSWNVGTGAGKAPLPGQKPKETSPKKTGNECLRRVKAWPPPRPDIYTTLHASETRMTAADFSCHLSSTSLRGLNVFRCKDSVMRKPLKVCRNNK